MTVYRIVPRRTKPTSVIELTESNYKQQLELHKKRQKKKISRKVASMVDNLAKSYVAFWKNGIREGTLYVDPRLSDDYINFLIRHGYDPEGPELHVRGMLVNGVTHSTVTVGSSIISARVGVESSAGYTPLSEAKNKVTLPLSMILRVHELGSEDGVIPPRPTLRHAMTQWAGSGGVARRLALKLIT